MARGWEGIIAAIGDTTGGVVDHRVTPYYNVGMLVGAPVGATTRHNGASQHSLHVHGDIHITPAGYTLSWEDDRPTQYVGVSLTPALMHSVADSMQMNIDSVSWAPLFQLRDEKIEHIVLAVKAELDDQAPHDRTYAEGLGLALATQLLRKYARQSTIASRRGLSGAQLHKVVDYVHEHLTRSLSLFELAAVTGLSPSHFKVLFKRSMGLPVHNYVMRCRVDRAVDLIGNGGLKLSQVALKTGFADQSHMSRWLRRTIGLTPAQLKRNTSE
ncbi:MAG TPA: AraC family transcriptional regulator [Candidatus Acidoferrales bacterium]|nr:AraC family transcriptional regulator [Candidatus Acidoferrales bacterium]